MKKIIFVIIALLLITFTSVHAKFYEGVARECPMLFNVGKWEINKTINGEEYWGREQTWIEGSWETHSGSVIELGIKHKSYSIQSDPQNPAALVYIGPWQKVTLTKGFLWNKEESQVEIRMIASQQGKFLESHYEIKDEENVKIPEQKFTPLEEPSDLITKCDIMRAQKWEYDAILEGHINIFRGYVGKSPFVTSGKMINAYTKEVLADFSEKAKE